MAQANFFAPGFDDQMEAQNIERQRQYAQALMSQGQQQPQGQMVSGHFVAPSWTQSLASVLKAYQGGKGMREADAKQKALAEAVRGRQAEEMGQFAKLMGGAPAQATGQQYQTGANEMGDEAATVPQWQGATKGDPRAAYQFAAGAKTPGLAQAGLQGLMQMPMLEAQQQERVDNRAFRQQEAEAARAQRMQELQMRMEDSRASQAERLAAQKEMREMQIQAQKDTQRMIAASRPAPERNAQIIQTENGPMRLVDGQAVPIIGADGKAVKGPKDAGAEAAKASQVASFDTMIGTLDRIGKHPGLDRSVGVVGAFPTMPGSDSANFQAELETFQSQAFLPMVSQLKGMGALSNAEGAKLTAAVGALNPKMGEKAFRESVARIQGDMQAARDRLTGSAPAPKELSPQDAQAMEWAKANPNDPRSAAIRQRLGAK